MGSAPSSSKKCLAFSARNVARVLGAALAVLLICLPLFSQGSQGDDSRRRVRPERRRHCGRHGNDHRLVERYLAAVDHR